MGMSGLIFMLVFRKQQLHTSCFYLVHTSKKSPFPTAAEAFFFDFLTGCFLEKNKYPCKKYSFFVDLCSIIMLYY